MIAQTSTAGDVGSLAGYLAYGKAANDNRVQDREKRVAWESGRNLRRAETIEEAKEQFRRAAARKARRVEKPYYQVIISWQSGNEEEGIPPDNPSRAEMEEVVGRALTELGLEEHQAWIVAHSDTSAPHVHVAVNRVPPRTGETWSPSYDQTTLYHTLREIEKEKGWHRPGPMNIENLSEGRQKGLEYWEEQAEKFGRKRSVRRWAREEGIPSLLKRAETWEQAEKLLHRTRATLKPRRKRGMVIERDGGHAALSSIDPTISRPKLEKHYGQPWNAYEEERQVLKERLSENLSDSSPTEEQLNVYRRVKKVEEVRQVEKTRRAGRAQDVASTSGLSARGEARIALVATTHYLWRGSEDRNDLRELMDELPGTEAEILENARRRGCSWAAGISLTWQQKRALDRARDVQRTRESHDSEESAPNDKWWLKELRSKLEKLEEEDFRKLMPVLEMEKRTEDRIRVMDEKGQASERARDTQADGVQEVLQEQWKILAGRLSEEQLSRRQKEAIRSLNALREEAKKVPYDHDSRRDHLKAKSQKEELFQRDLRKLSTEEVAELRGHLKAKTLKTQDLNEHCRIVLKNQADETTAGATDRIEKLLRDGSHLEAGKAFVQTRGKILDIEKEIQDIEEEGSKSESWNLESASLDRQFERRLEKRLSVEDLSRLELGTAEAKAEEDRARRGAQQDFKALGPDQKEAVRCCEVATRLDEPRLAQERLERASNLLAKMDTARLEEASKVIGEDGQKAFDSALGKAREMEQNRSEKSESKEGPQRERSRSLGRGRSRGRGR